MKKILACCLACLSTISTNLNSKETLDKTDSAPLLINKSERDDRLYQITQLSNGMNVLLVSDPKASKSLGAVALPIGSLADPESQQGLAHYTEHMVLMGSKNYPEAASFSQFLNQHAGSYNASTGQTRTAYFFEIEHSAFQDAIDRLADALGHPNLDPVNADKERNAVNAELTLARTNEAFRLAQVDAETVNPNHPARYFSGGNLETLSDKPNSILHDELVKFYQNYYSANVMVGILYSNKSIHELEQIAENTLATIPNHPVTLPEIKETVLPQNTLSKWIYVVPAQAKKLLYLQYPIENNLAEFNEKSDEYIAYLINSRSQNTLFDQLQQQGLIESISAYPYPNRYGNSGQFSIYITLTDKGLEQKELILSALENYLNLIKSDGISQEYYQEIQKALQLSFNYPDISRDMRYVEWLAEQMLLYPTQHILDADYIATDFEPQKIKARLDSLTLDNARVWVIAPNQETNKNAYFIDTPYRVEDISLQQKEAIHQQAQQFKFELPQLNHYIPDQFALYNKSDSVKESQVFNEQGNIMFYPSRHFAQEPKAVILLSLRNQFSLKSAKDQVQFALVEYLIKRKTAQLRYQASIGGVEVSFKRDNGLSLEISGFNQHIDQILVDLLNQYQTFTITEEELDLAKSYYLERLIASDQTNSYSLAMEQVAALSFIPYFSKEERKAIIPEVTKEELEWYAHQLLTQSAPYLLAIGNVDEAQLQTIYKRLNSEFQINGTYQPTKRLKITESEQAIFTQKSTSTDNALYSTYLPISHDKITEQMTSYLLYKILSPLFYDELRTKEQLGYVVSMLPSQVGEGFGLGFLVQSNFASPIKLQTHYDHFSQLALTHLDSLSEESFSQYKQGVLSELNEAPQTLDDEMNSYRSDFLNNQFDFSSKLRKIEALEAINKEDVIKFYRDAVINKIGLSIQSQILGSNSIESDKIQDDGIDQTASELQTKLLDIEVK